MKAARWVLGFIAIVLLALTLVYFAKPPDTLNELRPHAKSETRELTIHRLRNGSVTIYDRSLTFQMPNSEVVDRLEKSNPPSKGWNWSQGDGFYSGGLGITTIAVIGEFNAKDGSTVSVYETMELNWLQTQWVRLFDRPTVTSAQY